MRKTLRMLLIVLMAYFLQTIVVVRLSFLSVKPDVLAVTLVILAMLENDTFIGFCLGAATALLLDAMVGSMDYLYLVLYPLMGYAAAKLVNLLYANWPGAKLFYASALSAFCILLFEAVVLTYIYLTGSDLTLSLFGLSLRSIVYSAVLAFPFQFVVRYALRVRLWPRRRAALPADDA